MNTSETRIKKTFDEIKMPADLKNKTLDTLKKRDSKKRPTSFTRRAGFALAACLVLGALGFGGLQVYNTETALVGIELNPSIELGLNRFGRVIDTRALNTDGAAVLADVSLIGKSYNEAMALITQSEVFLSYVKEDSFVDVYVICDDDAQSAVLVSEGQEEISGLPYEGRCHRASSQEHAQAGEHGMGIGRYEAAQTLMKLDPSVTIKDCESMSMKEMQMRIAELDPKSDFSAHGNGGKGQHGHKGRHG